MAWGRAAVAIVLTAAASYFWGRNGQRRIVLRMAERLALHHTSPPPPALGRYWGYTATTPGDTVWIYRFILEQARPPVRDAIMWELRHATTEGGSDGFDQNFGFLTFRGPRSAKQGWSGFGADPPAGARVPGVDLWSEALHTTGTVGAGDRYITVLLTLHPRGTTAGTARLRTTRVTHRLVHRLT